MSKALPTVCRSAGMDNLISVWEANGRRFGTKDTTRGDKLLDRNESRSTVLRSSNHFRPHLIAAWLDLLLPYGKTRKGTFSYAEEK